MTATPSASRAAPAPVTSDATPDVPTIPVATGGGGSAGSGGTSPVALPIVVPQVIFGDGRSPGIPSRRPVEVPGRIASEPAVLIRALPAAPAPRRTPLLPAPPATAPPQAPVQRIEWAPDTPVTSLWGRVQPGWPAGVFFGLAGLLLAPLGGAWLGHRQARAAKAAAQIVGP